MRRMHHLSAMRSVAVPVMLWAGLVISPAALSATIAEPQDGSIEAGVYRNPYFGLALPLPSNWSAGLAGPPPSETGYYVLASFNVNDGSAGTVLIAAQDEFFAPKPFDDAMAMVTDLRQRMGELDGSVIDREPQETSFGGGGFAHVEFSGAGLYRAVLATMIRCHMVSFAMTASDPATRETLVHAVEAITLSPQDAQGNVAPHCLRDYARDENLKRKVEPALVGPAFVPIPVRLIIDADGHVAHVHVIRASPEQRRSIEEALSQWLALPYRLDGHNVAVETGRMFRLESAGAGAVKGR